MSAAITPVVMPKWGLEMREGTVQEWLVAEGARIEVGQSLVDVDTDKISNAVEATDAGLLRRIVAQPGELLPVRALLVGVAPVVIAGLALAPLALHQRGNDLASFIRGESLATRTAQVPKQWLIGYFWEPQYIHAEVPMKRVALPPYKEGCDKDKAKVACDYPPYTLNKIARAKWVEAGGPAVDFLKKFNWTNDDQNQVAADIAAGKSYDEAAKNWIDKNQDKVKAWLQS